MPRGGEIIAAHTSSHHPDVLPNTVRTQIAVATGNTLSYLNHPVYRRREPLLSSVARGRYEPYDLERHGEPGVEARRRSA